MVDFKLTNAITPMLTDKAQKQAKAEQEAKATAEPTEPTEPVAEKPKRKHSRAKEPVTAK